MNSELIKYLQKIYYKQKGNHLNLNNYREISVLNTSYKLIGKTKLLNT